VRIVLAPRLRASNRHLRPLLFQARGRSPNEGSSLLFKMSRLNYMIELGVGEPMPDDDLRERLMLHLSHRFAPKEAMDGRRINITSIPLERSLAHLEIRRCLEDVLDEADPRWRKHYTLFPRPLLYYS
jgi:hypothetical protein